MISHWLRTLPTAPRRALRATTAVALTAALAATLASCGGGGFTPLAESQANPRPLPASMVARASVNYSPYRTSRNPGDLAGEVITPANVLQDLRLIQATGIGNIRLFTSRIFSETVLQVIKDNNLDLKVQLGSFPVPPRTPEIEASNQADLDAQIRLANAFPDIVVAVSVGNEALVEWSTYRMEPAVLVGYLRKVRAAVSQPVTTNDNWLMWSRVPREVAEVVDFAAVHVYPFLDTFYDPTKYDWRQKSASDAERAQAMVDATITEAKKQFNDARAGLAKFGLVNIPMVIGETGWAAVDNPGNPDLRFRAHPVNQKMYFDALQRWAQEGRRDVQGPKAIFYFQAFDEPWKQSDDGWGLFNAQRQARYVLQSLGTCGLTWTCEPGSYTAADALRWMPPATSPAVSTPTFDVFADAFPAGVRADSFGGTTASFEVVTSDKAEGSASMIIRPTPANFGWGLVFSAPGFERPPEAPRTSTNLEQFASGALTFWVKSDGYPGRIRVGISSDDNDRTGQSAAVVLENGQYGYCNTNAWCQVTIPAAAFKAANPNIDFSLVLNKFAISDIFVDNGKPLNLTGLPAIRIDGVRWTR